MDGNQEMNRIRNHFCASLTTKPNPGIGKILVSGASGYVGGHLVNELLARGYQVKALTRRFKNQFLELWPDTEIVVADALDLNQLTSALKGVHTAYYLIHSLLLGPNKFETVEIKAAINFRKAAELNNVQRIIYLGALGDSKSELSPHLRTRFQVAEVLQMGKIKTTVLRAGIIIGPGSASYEIIKHLVEKLPIFLIPEWANTRCQPISIQSLINILVGVLETEESIGKTYDLGGKEILSYEEMLKTFAKIINKKKLFIKSPIGDIRLYTYFINMIVPVPRPIIRLLIESCRSEVICKNNSELLYSMHQPVEFKEAVVRALKYSESNKL